MFTAYPSAGARRPAFPPAGGPGAGGSGGLPRGGEPPPPPPPVEMVHVATHRFEEPTKVITSQAHLDAFLSDDGAGTDLLNYVVELAESCRGTTLKDADKEAALASAGEHTRECVRAIEAALDSLSALLDEVPPAAHAMRYGNPAYRVWHDRMCGMAYEACAAALAPAFREQQRGGDSTQAGSEHGNSTGEGAPGGTSSTRFESACCELRAYWCDSFGNRTRIDYGTGHETNFAAWLYCLRRTGALGGGVCDSRAVALCVFHRYLRLMRRVQTSYWLEPAGSHGVWGLDDYQFLPFVFGAAQLADHRHLRPRSIHVEMTREAVAGQYYYFEAVEFIRSVKRGSLHETSPIINDVSSLSTWARVYNGMVRMYRAEVLGKVPIMQHFLFGSLIRWKEPAVDVQGHAVGAHEEGTGGDAHAAPGGGAT